MLVPSAMPTTHTCIPCISNHPVDYTGEHHALIDSVCGAHESHGGQLSIGGQEVIVPVLVPHTAGNRCKTGTQAEQGDLGMSTAGSITCS